MKRPKFLRNNIKARRVRKPPPVVDLAEAADSCRYVGSPYHEDRPSFAAMPHSRRPDASICPGHLATRQELVQGWLREAIRCGQVGAWTGGYPKYVWFRDGETVYEARQGLPGSAEYHGYPLQPEHEVRGLE